MKNTLPAAILVLLVILVSWSCKKDNKRGIYSCVCNYDLNGIYYVNDTQSTFPLQARDVSNIECGYNGAGLTANGAKEVACALK